MDPARSELWLGPVEAAVRFTRPEPTWLSYIYRPETGCGSNEPMVPVTTVIKLLQQRFRDLNFTSKNDLIMITSINITHYIIYRYLNKRKSLIQLVFPYLVSILRCFPLIKMGNTAV